MRYQVGVYGGSFNPMHMGHVDCIYGDYYQRYVQAIACVEQLIKGKVETEHEL